MALSDAIPFASVVWEMDEASGNALDGSGNGYDATEVGTVGTDSAPANLGSSRDLNGVGERFTLASNADVAIGDNDCSILVVVNLDIVNQQGIVSKWNEGDGNEWLLYLDPGSSGRFYFFVRNTADSDGANVAANMFGAPSTGTPYWVCATHSASANQLTIAVNGGARDVTSSYTGGIRAATNPVIVGRFGGGNPLDAKIAQLIILKGYALSEAEEDEWYNGGAGLAFADWGAAPATVRSRSLLTLGCGA